MTDDHHALGWSHGALAVQRLGAMIGPAVFVLPDGRQVSPLHVAPWAGRPGTEGLPGILRRLRGEWPCVPFGYAVPPDPDTPPDWAGLMGDPEPGEEVHGHGANHARMWELADPGSLALSIGYPASNPVRRLTRVFTPDPAGAAIDFLLRIETRTECRLPLGLHFTFRLP